MNKPASLRQALEAALPDLKVNPDKLKVFIDAGGVATTATRSLSFEYAYVLNVVVCDYAEHPDQLIVAVLIWLRRHQPELLANRERMRDGFKFEVDIISHAAVDISIELKLTERVGVKSEAGKLTIEHFDEPSLDPEEGCEWELAIGGGPWPTT